MPNNRRPTLARIVAAQRRAGITDTPAQREQQRRFREAAERLEDSKPSGNANPMGKGGKERDS